MKGLSCRFALKNGKFELTEGLPKVRDNMFFLTSFSFRHRVYHPDFTTGLAAMIQKATSTIETYKVLLLGRLKRALVKYIPNVTVESMDLQYLRSDADKKYTLVIAYKVTDSQNQETEVSVTFI